MNSTIDERMTDVRNLDEPHFDEEATILAARPVVPLDEVRAARRPKWALALAIAGGLIIGLLAATLIFRYLGASQTTAGEQTPVEVQPANQLPPSAGGVAASTAKPEPTPIEETKAADVGSDESIWRDNEPEPEKSRRVPTEEVRAPEAQRRPVIVTESRPPVNDEEDEEVERATRRAARQDERRERRRTARQAKRQEQQSTQQPDDLTRIREIFEGSPKP